MNRIEKAQKFLLNTFDDSEYLSLHPSEYAYRYEHTQRVAHWGKKIAERESLNVEALVVACLLHDISYCEAMETDTQRRNHGRRSAELSKEFVTSLKFDAKLTHEILFGIATHVDDVAGFEGQNTILSDSVSDADNLDRFDVYRIYENMEYMGFSKMSLTDKLDYTQQRIIRSGKLLEKSFATNYATEIFHQELQVIIDFFTRLKQQFEASTPE